MLVVFSPFMFYELNELESQGKLEAFALIYWVLGWKIFKFFKAFSEVVPFDHISNKSSQNHEKSFPVWMNFS